MRIEFNTVSQLLSLYFNGSHLSSLSKILYPFCSKAHRVIEQKIFQQKIKLTKVFNLPSTADIYTLIAQAASGLEIKMAPPSLKLKNKKAIIAKIYKSNSYVASNLQPINRFRRYVAKKLQPYLVDAYIHGSLSTLDYTGFSDLDTLFIIKNEALKDPQTIRKLERLFIRSSRFLYEFDPLQHHGHFFLLESDLKFYSQAFLPVSAWQSATSLLGKKTELALHLRDSAQESRERFFESVQILRQYLTARRKRLANPYHLKGVLSHFMILPALFLQLQGQYVSKKESFGLVRAMVPESIWRPMEKVSAIRQDWDQQFTPAKRRTVRLIGSWNPLLLPFYAQKMYRCRPVADGVINDDLLNSMLTLTEHLYKAGGFSD